MGQNILVPARGLGSSGVRNKAECFGRNWYAIARELDPAANAALADRLSAVTGIHDPLQRRLHAFFDREKYCFQDRCDGAAASP